MFPGGFRPTGGPHPSGSRRRSWRRNKAAPGDTPRRRGGRAFHPGSYRQGFELLEPRQLLSGDLTQQIVNLLDNGTTNGSVTLNDVTLGSFLSSSSATVSLP